MRVRDVGLSAAAGAGAGATVVAVAAVLAGATAATGADPDLADAQHVAVEPVPGQVDLGLDRGPRAEPQHAGDRRRRVELRVPADVGAQRPRVDGVPGDAAEVEDPDPLGQLLGGPQAQ